MGGDAEGIVTTDARALCWMVVQPAHGGRREAQRALRVAMLGEEEIEFAESAEGRTGQCRRDLSRSFDPLGLQPCQGAPPEQARLERERHVVEVVVTSDRDRLVVVGVAVRESIPLERPPRA